jgi:hypothetical protein
MRAMGMVRAKIRPSPRPAISRKSAPRSGFSKLSVRLGARVRVAQALAEVYDALDFDGDSLKAGTGGFSSPLS